MWKYGDMADWSDVEYQKFRSEEGAEALISGCLDLKFPLLNIKAIEERYNVGQEGACFLQGVIREKRAALRKILEDSGYKDLWYKIRMEEVALLNKKIQENSSFDGEEARAFHYKLRSLIPSLLDALIPLEPFKVSWKKREFLVGEELVIVSEPKRMTKETLAWREKIRTKITR